MTFPHSADVRRTTKSGTKYTYGTVGSIACFLQPLEEQENQLVGITFGKGFHCYVPYTADAKEGDRLVINGTTYGVKGLRQHGYGNLQHKRLLLEAL